MACRQHHELARAIEKDRIRRDQERIDAHSGEPRKRCIDLADGAGIQNIDLLPYAAGGDLNVTHLHFGIGRVRVHQNSDRRGVGPQLAHQPQPLRFKVENKRAYTRDVAARPIEAGDEPAPDRVAADEEDDRYAHGRRLGRQRRYLAAWCNNDRHLSTHEIGGERRQSIVLSVSPAIVQGDVSTLEESGIIQASPDHRKERRINGGRTGAEEPNHRHRCLLRSRTKRPRSRRTAKQRYELTSPHSITSSARASSVGGTSKPSALAVLRLMTNSYFVGTCTGRSAGFAPLRMRSM